MGILALRDYKSSKVEFKGMQVKPHFGKKSKMGTQSVFHSSDLMERVQEQLIRGKIIFGNRRSRTKREISAVKTQIRELMGSSSRFAAND